MEATIEVAGLRKRFGPTVSLPGMSFTVLPGQVTGFVGPNGAGKSTTMRAAPPADRADERGLTIQATTGLHSLPLSPWAGLGVLATWSTAALLAGGLLLRLRDA